MPPEREAGVKGREAGNAGVQLPPSSGRKDPERRKSICPRADVYCSPPFPLGSGGAASVGGAAERPASHPSRKPESARHRPSPAPHPLYRRPCVPPPQPPEPTPFRSSLKILRGMFSGLLTEALKRERTCPSSLVSSAAPREDGLEGAASNPDKALPGPWPAWRPRSRPWSAGCRLPVRL